MELEKILAEQLDDFLVADNMLPQRQVRFLAPPRGMIGMVVAIKQDPRVKIKMEVYPNETEEPHFKVIYQNTTCRFKIANCEPMKAEQKNGIPTPIQKIMKHIKKTWENNKEEIIKTWCDSRPTDQNHGHQKIR